MSKKKKRKLTSWQKHVKSYMASHPGLSFKEALPKAKLTYQSGTKTPRKSKGRSNPKRRKKSMPKKRKRNAGASLQRTVFKWLRVGALVAPGIAYGLRPVSKEQKIDDIIQAYTGFRPIAMEFDAKKLVYGWGPFLMSVLTTYGIPKLAGIIRRL